MTIGVALLALAASAQNFATSNIVRVDTPVKHVDAMSAPICVMDGIKMRPARTNFDLAIAALGGYTRSNSIVYTCSECKIALTNYATAWVSEAQANELVRFRTLRLPVPEWPPYPVWPDHTNAPIVLIPMLSLLAAGGVATNLTPTDFGLIVTQCVTGIQFQWQSEMGKVYTVESSTNFLNWLPVTKLAGWGGMLGYSDHGAGQKWFRVSVPQ